MPPKVKARTKSLQPRPVRTLTAFFLVLAALIGLMFIPGHRASEPRLGLDLAGGAQVTLSPKGVCEAGSDATCSKKISGSQLSDAVSIIRKRVNGLGVTEADVQRQGNNIVVSVPGATGAEALKTISTTALVRFRVVITPAAGGPTAATPPPSNPELLAPLPIDAFDATDPTGASLQTALAELDCTDPQNRLGGTDKPAGAAIVACDRTGESKYILGPERIKGERINGASAGIPSTGGNAQVNLEFDGEGTKEFADVTTELFNSGGQFAIVLDDVVQSAPTVNTGPITAGRAQITGQFTISEADALAQVLKFGQLPVAFDTQEVLQVSATVGRDQLEKGLLAGAAGLVLVVIYSMLFYRALGVVSIASLVVAGGLTYITCSLLGGAIDFALILAGVIGVIVSIGITADSFVVYFERIRDEIREGKPIRVAVEKAWPRARRTILVADAVTFLAALVLYFLSIGRVQNFAFTLGLTTLIDVVVVFFFTKPLVTLLVRRPFFRDGHKLSGLNPASVGAQPRRAPLKSRVNPEPFGETA